MSVSYTRPSLPERRVMVTGLGLLSPLGVGVQKSWDALVQGRSGVDKISLFDSSNLNVRIAGEVPDFAPEDYIEAKQIKKMDRFTHFSMTASQMALENAGLNLRQDESLCERTGCILGVGIGGFPWIEEHVRFLEKRGPHRCSPFFIPKVINNMATGYIVVKEGLRGPNFSITSACASGAHAIGEAAHSIRKGVCDVMISGGTEAAICETSVAGFTSMKALSTNNEFPQKASRPWDKDRDGFVIAEGCGILILESYEHAVKRKASIYAELSGYGSSSDAYHVTSPPPDGKGAFLAMTRALADAKLNEDQIDYINAHGTSTPTGDKVECLAIKKTFKQHSEKLWVSSTKSMTGHALGGAGAMESVFSIKSVLQNTAPPTINLDKPSPDCDLDFVPHEARQKNIKHVLNNSFGFGGTNASLIFSQIE